MPTKNQYLNDINSINQLMKSFKIFSTTVQTESCEDFPDIYMHLRLVMIKDASKRRLFINIWLVANTLIQQIMMKVLLVFIMIITIIMIMIMIQFLEIVGLINLYFL